MERHEKIDQMAQVRLAQVIISARRELEDLDDVWRGNCREYRERRKRMVAKLDKAVADFEAREAGRPWQPFLDDAAQGASSNGGANE